MLTSAVTVIKPKNSAGLDLKELWQYRELFSIFTWRDIKVRYKQTFFGIAWAVFQPLATMVIFSFFFGKLAGIPSGKLPYVVFVYTGLVVWTFFSNALTQSSSSLIEHGDMIKKVYFPRLIIPLSSVITNLLDFGITLILFLPLLLIFKISPHPLTLLLFPLLLLILLLTTSGLGLFLSAVNIKYRDVRYVLPFFIQIMIFLTPVIYPTTIIAAQHKWILALNPLTSIIEVSRGLISGQGVVNWSFLAFSLVWSVVIFFVGLTYFRRTEGYFSDIA